MLDVESVELDAESVLAVLVDVLEVLLVVNPSDSSAEAMAAASGLTLFEPDEPFEAMDVSVDVESLLVFCPFAREVIQAV